MRHSKFLDAYLDLNAWRVENGQLPITIGTYLSSHLRGRAKKYIMNYKDALMRSCMDVGAKEVPSKGGSTAFVR